MSILDTLQAKLSDGVISLKANPRTAIFTLTVHEKLIGDEAAEVMMREINNGLLLHEVAPADMLLTAQPKRLSRYQLMFEVDAAHTDALKTIQAMAKSSEAQHGR